jgi:hypothetical protein
MYRFFFGRLGRNTARRSTGRTTYAVTYTNLVFDAPDERASTSFRWRPDELVAKG